MEQTAVEFIVNELLYLDNEIDMKLIDKNEYYAKRKKIIEQAKAMEKEQIIEAYERGWDMGVLPNDCNSEQYYNETFKSE